MTRKRRGRPRKQDIKRQPNGQPTRPARDYGSAGAQAIRQALDNRGIRMEKATLVIDLLHETGKIDDGPYHAGLRYRTIWNLLRADGPKQPGTPGIGGAPPEDKTLTRLAKELRFFDGCIAMQERACLRSAVIYNLPPRAMVVEKSDRMRLRSSDMRQWDLLMQGLRSLAAAHDSWGRRSRAEDDG